MSTSSKASSHSHLSSAQESQMSVDEESSVNLAITQAPLIPIALKKYLCVEYPGYVKNLDRALESMGGEKTLGEALSSTLTSSIDLRYHKKDIFRHAIKGDIYPTTKLVAKVTRRIKRTRDPKTGTILSEEEMGPYQTEVLGIVTNTVRFRALSDFQYIVPMDDPIRKLKESLLSGDVEKILDYKIATDDGDFENLRSIPPPVFTNIEGPFSYGYRQNAPIVRVKVRQPDGTFKIKLINRQKYTGFGITSAKYEDNIVPKESAHPLLDPKPGIETEAMEAIERLFEERPIWNKAGIKSRLDPKYHKLLTRTLIHYAYTFYSGPWRDTWVKYGIDPRRDKGFAIYQQIDIRRSAGQGINIRKLVSRRNVTLTRSTVSHQDEELEPQQNRHIFDGKTTRVNISFLQLCDIIDPDIVPLIRNPDYLKSEPSKLTGYYYQCVYERIRNAVRKKHIALMDTGKADPMPDLEEGLEEEIKKENKIRPGDELKQTDLALSSVYNLDEKTAKDKRKKENFPTGLSNVYADEAMDYLRREGLFDDEKDLDELDNEELQDMELEDEDQEILYSSE